VESNPGPACIRLGVFNACGANRKGAQLDDLIRDHKLDVLALNETWIRDDAPAAVKHDIVPDNFRVLHTHRETNGRRRAKRGGGLALIYSQNLTARFHNCNIKPTSFELQVVELKIGRTPVLIANIYRPPSSSKSDFLDEFEELLTCTRLRFGEKLVICRDLNMPGTNNTVDNQLQALLDIHGYVQLVNTATRGNNLLDVVITRHSDKSPVVTNVNIFNSYGLSDHAVLVCELTTKRYKPAPVHYTYRDIKNIDVTEFQERL